MIAGCASLACWLYQSGPSGLSSVLMRLGLLVILSIVDDNPRRWRISFVLILQTRKSVHGLGFESRTRWVTFVCKLLPTFPEWYELESNLAVAPSVQLQSWWLDSAAPTVSHYFVEDPCAKNFWCEIDGNHDYGFGSGSIVLICSCLHQFIFGVISIGGDFSTTLKLTPLVPIQWQLYQQWYHGCFGITSADFRGSFTITYTSWTFQCHPTRSNNL